MKDTFSDCHPLINFGFLLVVILFSMCFLQPVYLVIALAAAFTYSVYLNGKRGLKFNLLICLPMLILAMILNPLFTHEGATILGYFWNGNPLTLESIFYGCASATMFVAVIMWFSCYNAIMTSDKFIYLFGRLIPSISLVFSMIMRFVPKFRNQAKIIANGQKCIGRDPMTGNFRQRLRNGVRIMSILITWGLENGIETADSMRSRGYGLKGRTSFSIFRFDTRDKLLGALLGVVLLLTFVPIALGSVYIVYYPEFIINPVSGTALVNYIAYGIFCFMPMLLNITEDIKWRVLKSKI